MTQINRYYKPDIEYFDQYQLNLHNKKTKQKMEFIRKMQFIFKGYRTFTKRDKPFPEIITDMTGKNFVITGANSGIGLAAAKKMAQLNATVYLVCRNQKRGMEAVKKIVEQTNNKNVYLILGEMGQRDSMQGVYKQLRQRMTTIDVLVHNAGCMIHERQFTKEKIEKNFAANSFAVYYLTRLLLPLLGPESRVITVSSGGMLTQKLILDDIYMQKQKFDGTTQYARNKRQQIAITEQFAKQYSTHGKFVTMHPGWVDTEAVRTAMPDFHKKFEKDLKCQDEGADTIVYLSTMPLQQVQNAQFYYDREVADKHLTISCTGYSDKEAGQLMSILHKLETA